MVPGDIRFCSAFASLVLLATAQVDLSAAGFGCAGVAGAGQPLRPRYFLQERLILPHRALEAARPDRPSLPDTATDTADRPRSLWADFLPVEGYDRVCIPARLDRQLVDQNFAAGG